MVFLKKLSLIIVGFTCFAITLNGQVNAKDEKIILAFKDSYALESKNEFAKAADCISIYRDETTYEINLRLGWLMYKAGKYSESANYYLMAVKQMPLSIEARLGLVQPLSLQSKWDDIVTQYKKILEIDPNQTTTNYRLGLIYYNRKDYQAAYKYFEKVINLYPFDYDTLLMFGWTNLQMGKLKEAKILFTKVLMYSPSDTSAMDGLKLIK